MATYNIYPAVDSGYNFPPEVRSSLSTAAEFGAATSSALIAAKSYADVQRAAAYAYTDSAKTAANSYTDSSSATALTNAKSYSDSGNSSTLSSAKSYTDTQTSGFSTFQNTVNSTRQYYTYRWTSDTDRANQTGMRYGDKGFEGNNGIEYRYDGTNWQPWDSIWITYYPVFTSYNGGVTNIGRYKYRSGLIRLEFTCVCASGGTAGVGTFNLPVNADQNTAGASRWNAGSITGAATWFNAQQSRYYPVWPSIQYQRADLINFSVMNNAQFLEGFTMADSNAIFGQVEYYPAY